MRKFPKLVAIVLAIAIVICPAMCLSAMADSPNGYSLSYNEGVLTITVTSETGFMVSYLNVDIEGYAVDEQGITVTTAEGRAFSANPIFEDGVLALLVAPTEAYDISLVTEAVVSVPLEELVEAERYYIALTKIQAADAGTASAPESFLVFDGVDANGNVEEVIPTVDALPHECDVVNYVDNGDGTHNGVCDCEDATVLIENEDHSDENADNVCDLCLADIDNGGSEEPEDPICEHENLTYVKNNDGTHTVSCADCADYSETVAHTENGLCACGVDTRLQVAKISLAYGTSSLELNFRMLTNGVLNLYPKMEFVLVAQKYNKDTLNLETADAIVIDSTELVTAGKYKQYTYKDIQLYELALEIDYIIKGYDADGNLVAVSDAEPFTAVGDLKGQIEDPNKPEDFKRLMVDTLVVCDEVMNNVAASYTNSSLAAYVADNSVLDGIDTSLATQTIKTPNQVDTFNSFNANFTQASSATHRIRSSVAIGKVPYINFRIKDSNDALDRSKLTVTVAYTSKDSAGEHPYSKTFGSADFTDAGDYINLEFAEIGFHDSNKDIVFTVVYDGATVCDWTYSIETYLNSKQNDPTIGDQSIALIKLGQSFRTYQKLD